MSEKYKQQILEMYGQKVLNTMIRIEQLEKRITFVNDDLQRMTNEMAEKIEILEKDIKTIKVINFAGL
tara:strand:+ start:1022 stop:1225 length:204 start_codon:yes stop_codon:yes gene_type:complete